MAKTITSSVTRADCTVVLTWDTNGHLLDVSGFSDHHYAVRAIPAMFVHIAERHSLDVKELSCELFTRV